MTDAGVILAVFDVRGCERCSTFVPHLPDSEMMGLVILHAVHRSEERIMGALEDLQAADANLANRDAELVQAVTGLATEQATFLRDVADRLANAGVDPATLNQITADLNTKADDLATQADQVRQITRAQAAADPGPSTPVVQTEPTATDTTTAQPAPVDQTASTDQPATTTDQPADVVPGTTPTPTTTQLPTPTPSPVDSPDGTTTPAQGMPEDATTSGTTTATGQAAANATAGDQTGA